MTDQLLLQTILSDLRELRAEVGELRTAVAQARGGWKAISIIASIVGACAGGIAAWFSKGGHS